MADFEFHPATLASDTTDLQAGTLSRINDAVTKGAPAAAVSGALSIYNSFTSEENELSVEDTLRGIDESYADYYSDHQTGADVVGFVASSLLPGSLGVKALQVARAGQALGAVGRALNLTNTKRLHYLKQALQETAESGGTIKSILDKTRRTQLGWEVADQALLGTAFELAVVATMHDSPVFEGDTIGDFAWNVTLGTVLSGGIGGALSSLGARGILKDAQTTVQKQMRLADTVFDPARMGLVKGTETLLMAESIAKLADDLGNTPFKFTFDGKPITETLNTAGVFKTAADRATKTATADLAIKFNELAQGNVHAGQAYFAFLQEGVSAAKAAGKDAAETIELLHGWLQNVEKVGNLDLDRIALDKRKFYVNLAPIGDDPETVVKNLFSLNRTATTSKQPYMLADGVTAADLRVGNLEELGEVTIKSAFRNNPELDVIRLPDGSNRINPASERVIKLSENPNQFRMFVDLPTGSLSAETVPTFADTLRTEGAVFAPDFVRGGNKTYVQKGTRLFSETLNPLETSARFAWASKLTPGDLVRVTGGRIELDDLPVLSRLVELEPKVAADTLRKMKFIDGADVYEYDDLISLRQLLEQKRYELLEKELGNWTELKGSVPDSRVFASALNVDRTWVEEAIERGFRAPKQNERAIGKALSTEAALTPKAVELTWSFPPAAKMLPEEAYKMNMGPSHLATQALTKEYQLRIRSMVADNAFNVAMGQDAQLFMAAPAQLAREASSDGAGAGLFGASNASYGEKAKLWVQDTGKNVALVSQKRRDEVIETLAPHINALRESPKASAELGILTTALRKSEHRYIFSPQNPKQLISLDAMWLARRENMSIDEALEMLAGSGRSPHSFEITEDGVAEFLRTSTRINDQRQGKLTALYNAAGVTRNGADDAVIYAPPINTVKYPYHAFVRTKEKLGLASDVSMITAKSEEQLRELAARVGDDYDVFFKGDQEKYFKAKGEYDYALTLNEGRVNSDLARKGVLADFFPETRLENVMTDWLEWHAKSEEKLVRTAVQVKNRQFFSELSFLSEQFRQVSESVSRGIGARFKSKVADPFGDYTKTALNISKQQEFPLLDSLNDFVDKIGLKAGEAVNKAWGDAKAGVISYEDANKVMADYGMGNLYQNAESYFIANERYPRNLIRETAQKVNLWLATSTLRLDFANSLVNIISTPILLGTEMQSLKGLIKGDSALAGKLTELMSVKVPGRNASVPSTTKLIGNAINNFFGAEKNSLINRYRDIGAVKDVSQLYHEVLDDLSFRANIVPSEWAGKVSAAVEKGAKITGNTFAEDFTRFVSADVMRQLSEPLVTAQRLTRQEQNAYISTFVNRVQGNYVTSQRPIVFQGTTGAAVSLFQTYAFNVLQQLHRHIQAGDKKTLAVFAGLQSTMFGMNGLPFFDAVNTHLVGSMVANNPQHTDAYSALPSFNKELGDWMLYGTASAFPLFTGSMPALYTRGDINPRHITILPTSIVDVPAVSASIKLYDTIVGMAKNVKGGADVSSALLQGLEHQGWNRPLAGAAQLFGGRSTTSSGALVSAANDIQATSWLGALAERTVEYGGVSRLMGARPMDESVALTNMYRNKTYESMDRARLERLGQTVKSKLYNGEAPDQDELEDFMLRYTRTGGRLENFSQAMQRWSRDANVSIINQTAQRMGSPYAQKLQTIMGGEAAPDYVNGAQSPVLPE